MMSKGWREIKTGVWNHPKNIYIISDLRVILSENISIWSIALFSTCPTVFRLLFNPLFLNASMDSWVGLDIYSRNSRIKMFINIISHFFCTEIQLKKKEKKKTRQIWELSTFFPLFLVQDRRHMLTNYQISVILSLYFWWRSLKKTFSGKKKNVMSLHVFTGNFFHRVIYQRVQRVCA